LKDFIEKKRNCYKLEGLDTKRREHKGIVEGLSVFAENRSTFFLHYDAFINNSG